jgi:FKBP-type peptidyl-prolyl cis-trans isomerase FkpA
MTKSRTLFVTLIASCGITLAACNEPSTGPSHPASETFAASLNVDIASMTKVAEDLYIKDLVVGTGTQAARGHSLRMRYTGSLKDGTQFDMNQSASGFGPFTVGQGHVIVGWDLGVVGMRVGGTRQLVIGSNYGYGNAGSGRSIPGGATLVFVVELVSVQ